MAQKVVWNKRALQKFDEIITYLEADVSEKAAIGFILKVDDLIHKLCKYPEIGRKTKKYKTVRQYKIDNFKRLYYRFSGKKLIIVYFFDDRQNPEINPY